MITKKFHFLVLMGSLPPKSLIKSKGFTVKQEQGIPLHGT